MRKRRGRQVHRGRKFWERTVREYAESGKTQATFASEKKLKLSTLGRWVRLLRKEARGESLIGAELIEIVSPPPECFHATTISTRLIIGAATVEFSELPPASYMTSLLREAGSC